MLAVEMQGVGSPDVLFLNPSYPQPLPGLGEVLIKVHAAGVNRPDIAQRKGIYPPPPGASPLLGLEVAGEIVGGDYESAGWSLGDRVCALAPGGGYAQYCVVPAGHCLPIPAGLTMIEAASLPETFFTVWVNVFQRGALLSGESLLVHGGASGIGVTAIQMACAHGATVYATAGSDERARHLESLGASRGINYKSQDFVEEVLSLTAGRGVDVILDMVAGDYTARNIKCLADDGRLSVIALMGGAKSNNISMNDILRRRLTITGSTLRPRSVEFKQGVAQALKQHVWPWFDSGRIQPKVYAVYPLEEVAQAHELMESGQHIGKIVLTIPV